MNAGTAKQAGGPRAWSVLCGHPRVATRTYSFGPGVANSLAVEVDGAVVVVSPPPRAASAADELASWGEVRAIVAPNAFHTMGIGPWKERFPAARVFAPEQAIARVQARSGLAKIETLSAAVGILGEAMDFIDLPHYRTGEALVRIRTAEGMAWSIADAILNLEALPAHPVARLAFWASGSAPGLRRNRIAPLFMVRDSKAQRAFLREQLERDAPRWFVPGHGAVVDLAGNPGRLAELL